MTGVPLPPLSITGGASAPAVAEAQGGNFGSAIQTINKPFGVYGMISVVIIAGALLWINRK